MTKKISVDGNPLVIEAARLLRERGQTLSFAESCTGGVLSAVFTRLPGVSDVFKGAIVAYANEVKENLLGVPSPLLLSMGAVSLPVAKRMAEGVREALDSTWALSTTGIAGPGGGSAEKPVGLVCFGLCGPGVDVVVRRQFSGTRREIQIRAARFALRLLLRELGSGEGLVQIAKKKPKGAKNS
jgi:PncC family amidohydrolase